MAFPQHRMRRLRRNDSIRRMVRETHVGIDDLVYPLFVMHGNDIREEIPGLPGMYHYSIDRVVEEVNEARELKIPAVLLFGLPARRDASASESYARDGIVQTAIREIKAAVPDMLLISDTCLCEYTENGHCGIVNDGELDNDRSLELLTKVAVSQADAGADIVAPAAMLDGQIAALRRALDAGGHSSTAIMSYSAKYASALFDPFFKEGTHSVVKFGDKKTHQMDFGNAEEALREIEMDIEEGVDIVMVKPGMMHLDVVYRAKERFRRPLAVYSVSGEYAMMKAAAKEGLIDERRVLDEMVTAMKRAGADIIITYYAKELARLLRSG